MMHTFVTKQRGVSLVEILVTLVLISIAVLGSAAMQVFSKRANNQAVQRTTAAYLASDLFERMRSNRAALASYLPAAELGGGTQGGNPTIDCALDGANCTTDDLAVYDLWEWEQQLDGAAEQANSRGVGGMLEATACITGPAGGIGGNYEVAIAWRGLEEHVNPVIHDCGEDSGKYGENNEFRHVMVINAFVDDV
jgi:type IV pilus assembly protein PilV